MTCSLPSDSFPRNEARVIPRKNIRDFAYRQGRRGRNSVEFVGISLEGGVARLVDDQRNNLSGEKEQRFQGSVGTRGRGVRVCVYQEEIPVFFEIKEEGGNIDGKARSYRIYEPASKHVYII